MSEAIVKHISWVPQNQQIIGYKYPERDIPTNSILEVKPGQVAILVQYSEEGTAAKTFPAGRYQLETSLPVGEKKGFFRRLFSKATGTNIYQCDIYFFLAKTKFTTLEWSTKQGPISCGYVDFKILKGDSDAEAEATTQIYITLKGGGTYGAHLVFDEFDDPDTIKTIVENIMSNTNILTTDKVEEIMTSRIVQNISNAFGDLVGQVGSDIFNLGRYFNQLSSVMKDKLTPILKEYGIELDFFAIDRLNYPDDVKAEIKEYEQMRKERIAEYNKTMAEIKKERYKNLTEFEKRHYENIADDEMRRTYGYMQDQQIGVMRTAAANEGMAGTFMGAGMGLGMGVGMGGVFVPYDGGAIWITRGSPFSQRISAESSNDTRRIHININAEFLSA